MKLENICYQFFIPHLICIKASNFTSGLGAIPGQMGDWLSCIQPEVKFDTIILLKCGEKFITNYLFSISTQEQRFDQANKKILLYSLMPK